MDSFHGISVGQIYKHKNTSIAGAPMDVEVMQIRPPQVRVRFADREDGYGFWLTASGLLNVYTLANAPD